MRLLVRGSGFKSPFPDQMTEIRCGKALEIGGDPACHWSPSNPDMEALGSTSGGSIPAGTLAELADVIERQKTGSIDELRILGHSSEDFFALGGTIVTNDARILVKFNEPAMIGESLTFRSLQSRFRRARDRFAEKGKITLAGCGSGGTNAKLLELVSRTFLVCVAGFVRPIQYAINTQFPLNSPIVRDNSGKEIGRRIGPGWVINIRGRVSYSSATLRFEEILGTGSVDHLAFSSDAWSLASDAISCVGQIILDSGKRASAAGANGMGGAVTAGSFILQQFFPDKGQLFSGVSGDETLRGLRFEAKGGGGMLIIGKPYAQGINPTTLDQRISEMADVIKLAEAKQSGTVPMK